MLNTTHIYIYTHTHTYIYIYIYIFLLINHQTLMCVENPLHYLRRRNVFDHKFQRDEKKTQTKEVKLIEATFWLLRLNITYFFYKKKVEYYLL